MTREGLNTYVDTEVTNKTAVNSLTPINEGNAIKKVADYVDEKIVLKTIKRVLSSSEILSLFTTPIEIVPSVEGKVLVPQFLFQKYNHNTTAFTTSGLFRIGLGTTSFGFVTFGAVITSAEDSEGLNNLIYAQSTSGLTYANLPIVVRATTANPEAGDGELELHLTYLEITV